MLGLFPSWKSPKTEKKSKIPPHLTLHLWLVKFNRLSRVQDIAVCAVVTTGCWQASSVAVLIMIGSGSGTVFRQHLFFSVCFKINL